MKLKSKSTLGQHIDRLIKERNAAAHGDKSIVVPEEDLIAAISLVEKLMDLEELLLHLNVATWLEEASKILLV